VLNPPKRGERVQIFNQMTETHRVRDLAKMISERTGTPIDWQDNPRNEASDNELLVQNESLLKLGLKPTLLQDGLLEEIMEVARCYRDRVDRTKIPAKVRWVNEPRGRAPNA